MGTDHNAISLTGDVQVCVAGSRSDSSSLMRRMFPTILEARTKPAMARPSEPHLKTKFNRPSQRLDGEHKESTLIDAKMTTRAEKIAMYERAADLPLLLTTWVLVVDAGQAQLYECLQNIESLMPEGLGDPSSYRGRPGNTLVPVKDGVIEAATLDDYHAEHYPYDTTWAETSQSHDVYDLYKYIKTELNRRFTQAIADKLHKAYDNNLFDRLVLVSPSKLIAELREKMDVRIQNAIVGILSRDFVQQQD